MRGGSCGFQGPLGPTFPTFSARLRIIIGSYFFCFWRSILISLLAPAQRRRRSRPSRRVLRADANHKKIPLTRSLAGPTTDVTLVCSGSDADLHPSASHQNAADEGRNVYVTSLLRSRTRLTKNTIGRRAHRRLLGEGGRGIGLSICGWAS